MIRAACTLYLVYRDQVLSLVVYNTSELSGTYRVLLVLVALQRYSIFYARIGLHTSVTTAVLYDEISKVQSENWG